MLAIALQLLKLTASSSGAEPAATNSIIEAIEQDHQQGEDIGDVFFDADMNRPKRSYPSSLTPYVGPPYAHEVMFVNQHQSVSSAVDEVGRKRESDMYDPSLTPQEV